MASDKEILEETKQKLGKPENLVCWLVGGHFGNPPKVSYVAYNRETLDYEIKMHHYENPRANAAGVKILGITEQGPDDIRVEEEYELVFSQLTPVAFAIYLCKQDVEVWDRWNYDSEEFVKVFARDRGYDTP